jgi:hypothetical protein
MKVQTVYFKTAPKILPPAKLNNPQNQEDLENAHETVKCVM